MHRLAKWPNREGNYQLVILFQALMAGCAMWSLVGTLRVTTGTGYNSFSSNLINFYLIGLSDLQLWQKPNNNSSCERNTMCFGYVQRFVPFTEILQPKLQNTSSPVQMCWQLAIWPPTTKYLPLTSHLSDLYSGKGCWLLPITIASLPTTQKTF